MDANLADSVVHATRVRAVEAARSDLRRQCRLAFEAGREESRRLIKTSHIDQATGDIRYNPAGRLLRDWYLHNYLNTLRSALGLPAETIDAQQIEDTAAMAHGLVPQPEAIHALRAVAVVRNTAVDDAHHAVTTVVEHLHDLGARRAIAEAPDGRFASDQVSVHVTRHWYLRCYLDDLEAATDSRPPLRDITVGEEQEVAHVLQTGTIRRVIGRDGIPLITRHGRLLNDIDRRLASGETGVVPANITIEEAHTGWTKLGSFVRTAWRNSDPDGRAVWAAQSGARDVNTDLAWRDLQGDQQNALLRRYLAVNRADVIGQVFDRQPVRGDPADAARLMFNHRAILDVPKFTPPGRDTVDTPTSTARAATTHVGLR